MVRVVGRYVLGLVLVVALIAAGVLVRVVRAGSADDRAPVDAIVVLGAAQYDGRPSAVYAARLDHAAALYRSGVAPRVLTLGGSRPGDRFTEAEAGRRYLRAAGLPDAALLVAPQGEDTLVSLEAAARLLGAQGRRRVVLVTDPWHGERSRLMARDQGLTVALSPVDTGPAVAADVRVRYIARETAGTLFYLATGASSGAGTPVL